MNFKTRVISSLLLLATTPLFAALESEPKAFDYGWAPNNARIFCEFTITNKGNDAVALQALKPACGCTAAHFTPTSLASEADTKIGLTFNTRGYKGQTFSKTAELTTEANQSNLVVILRGHVTNPNAKFYPDGSGIAEFGPESDKNTEKITLHNKTDKDLKLNILHMPASWAKVKLQPDTIKAGQSGTATIQVSGSFDQVRETSITLEGTAEGVSERVTLAVRTGPAPKEYQPIRPTRSAPDAGPRQSGYNDPLKLKPIEPVKSKSK